MIKSLVTILSMLSLIQGFSPRMPQKHAAISKDPAIHIFGSTLASSSIDFTVANSLNNQFGILLLEARRCALSADTSISQAQSYLTILTKVNSVSNGGDNGNSIKDDDKSAGAAHDSNKNEVIETISQLRAKITAAAAADEEKNQQQKLQRPNHRRRKTMPLALGFDSIGHFFSGIDRMR